MNIEQEMDWINKSKNIDSLDLEVCFQIQDQFYIGDPNNLEQIQDDNFREPLQLPDFERVVPTIARTSEVIENTDKLASYYKGIVEKSAELSKPFNEIRQYFWLRLWFWNTDEDVHISFPWYDSLSDMQQFFSWLNDNNVEPFMDVDQGWQIDAVRVGENIHIRQTDPDYDEEHVNISLPYEKLLKEVHKVEKRAQHIITNLSKELGIDVWSKYLQDANFGSEMWQPNKTIKAEKTSWLRQIARFFRLS